MRHDRRAEDADGDVQRGRVRQGRHKAADDAAPFRLAEEDFDQKGNADRADQRDYHTFQFSNADMREQEQEQSIQRCEHHAVDQRQAE